MDWIEHLQETMVFTSKPPNIGVSGFQVGASSHIMSHPMAVSLPTATVGPDKRMRVYVSATYLHMFAIHMLYTKS